MGEIVSEDDRPLVLVVCSDPDRLARLRAGLRESGIMPASGRSIQAAVSLLSQVQVNGCALAEAAGAEEIRQLDEALRRNSPHSSRLYVREAVKAELPEWEPCDESSVPEAVRRTLQVPAQPR